MQLYSCILNSSVISYYRMPIYGQVVSFLCLQHYVNTLAGYITRAIQSFIMIIVPMELRVIINKLGSYVHLLKL